MENGSPLSPDKTPSYDDSGLPQTGEDTQAAQTATPAGTPEGQAAAAPPVAPISSPGVSQALKQLMDREASIREAQQQLSEQKRAVAEANALRDLAKSNPLDFLDRIGFSTEQLTEQLSQRGPSDPTQEIKSELQQLKEELAKRQQAEEQQRKEQALQEAQSIVKDFVYSNADAYPLTSSAGMHELVYQRIYDHYINTREALSEADAAKEIEDYLAGIKAKWLQERDEEQPSVTSKPSTTLTNSLAAQNPTRVEDRKFLSEDESILKAASLLQFVNK